MDGAWDAEALHSQLPPLCRAMVLKDRDTTLTIPMAALASVEAGSGFSIAGPLNTPVFQVSVCQALPSGRYLTFSVPRLRQDRPWAVVRPMQEETEQRRKALLEAAGGEASKEGLLEMIGPDETFFGLIVPQEGGLFRLIHASLGVMVLRGDRASYELIASSTSGHHVALISRTGEIGTSQHLNICVKPGTDPLLVVACALGILLII